MVVEDECENFFKKMLSLNETILPNDILKKEKEFNQVVFSLNLVFDNEYDDVFFLSGLLFTLTKFTYTRNVLISRLFKYHDDKALKFFEKIPFGIKINTNQNVEDFLSEVKSLTLKIGKCKSHFSFFKRKNNLTSPDFQYIYKNNFSDIEIPESNFSIIFENSKKSIIKIKYNSSLYSNDFVELFYSSFVMTLNKFYNEKKTLLKNISINPNIKKKTDVFKTLPMKSIGELFEKIVEKNEDKLALIANDTNLTYGELNREANCVANSLIKKGLKIEDRVIIDLNRDSKLIISILGVIKSGGTLILINSFLPKDRVSFIKLNASPKYILTNDKMDSDDNNPEDDDSVITIDLLLNNECEDKNPSVNLKKDNVFSIIYTSGTTGIPKGVMLPHESMIKEIDDVHRFYNDDNFKTLIGLSVLFSGFIQSLLVELLSGVTVVLADDDVYRDPLKLYKTFKETDFNLIASTPSAIEMYLEFDILKEMIKQLKIIVLGGEKVDSNLVKKIHEVNSDINLFVGYGLTETFSANIKLLKPDGNINVGKPILNVVEIVVDIDGNPLPPGVLGELWIGGLNISKGYWRDEKLTKENFVKIDDVTYFKTGDLAKYDESGEYTLFSRIDDQLSIHGYRIEIGEIESNIPQNIGLKKSIATVKEINNEPTICLYFTTTIKLSKTIDKLKNIIDNELKDKLPLFMVPRFYIQVDDFIFTQTGKVNTKGLPEPQPSDLISNQRMLSPETEIEKNLFNISSELLGHDNFGINSNFSSIGFSSLLLTKLLSYIFESYDVEINSRSLPLENTNIQNISEQIKKSSTINY